MKKILILAMTALVANGVFAAQPDVAPPYQPTDSELASIRAKLDEFQKAYKALPIGRVLTTLEKMEKKIFPVDVSLLPDVEVYGKAADWMLRYPKEEFWTAADVKNTLDTLELGLARVKQIAEGKPSWPTAKGCLVRGFRSKIDGSVQPYALKIPDSYDPKKPIRLDVILHGFGPTMNEANFIAGRDTGKPVTGQDYIRLEVFGRLNNGYRWCGETDVLEAMESVKARYAIDPERIVLRGFSMGGAGAWGMGLHYADMWAAFEAGGSGAGGSRDDYKNDAPSSASAAVGRIYGNVGWMLNAANVPTVGYCGEEDTPIKSLHTAREHLASEGFKFTESGLNWVTSDIRCVFLVGAKTEHKWAPESQAESNKFIDEACVKGRQPPAHIRFVSYSLRYNHCFDLTVDAVETGYARTEVDALASPDKKQRTIKTKNVARLILPYPMAGQSITLDGQMFPFGPMQQPRAAAVARPAFGVRRAAAPVQPLTPPQILFEKKGGKWATSYVTDAQLLADPTVRKRSGLQGPINDFLMDSFVCVRPTGAPQHPLANDYAKAAVDRFAKSFSKWLRGDIRIKNDTEITRDDIANSHLVVFGDAGSNRLIAQIADKLPVHWDKTSVRVGKKSFDANEHVPAFICPNPYNSRRYMVVNSGDNLLGTRELRKTVALAWQQLADYDVLKLSKESSGEIQGKSVASGLFDENWKATEK